MPERSIVIVHTILLFARSCAMHTIARNACKIEYTVFVISKHISANIIFHQGGLTRFAPTGNTQFSSHQSILYKHKHILT